MRRNLEVRTVFIKVLALPFEFLFAITIGTF